MQVCKLLPKSEEASLLSEMKSWKQEACPPGLKFGTPCNKFINTRLEAIVELYKILKKKLGNRNQLLQRDILRE